MRKGSPRSRFQTCFQTDHHNDVGECRSAEQEASRELAIAPQNALVENGISHAENDGSMNQGCENPPPEDGVVEELASLTDSVEDGIAHSAANTAAPIKESDDERGRCSEANIVQTDGPAFEHGLAGEGRSDGKVKLHDVKANVLVIAVENQLSDSLVAPCTVDEQQFL
jgi:hypothetical protein